MTFDTLYIGGGFDVFHKDHRKFIQYGISEFSKRYGILKNIVIGLKSDKKINKQKGSKRPFFAYEWRINDVSKFLSHLGINFKIIGTDNFDSGALNPLRTVVQLVSGLKKDSENKEQQEFISMLGDRGFSIIFVPYVDIFHTSDLETRLLELKEKSNCNVRKVSAILVRDGEVVKEGYSGNGDCNSCSKYKAYSEKEDTTLKISHAIIHMQRRYVWDLHKVETIYSFWILHVCHALRRYYKSE